MLPHCLQCEKWGETGSNPSIAGDPDVSIQGSLPLLAWWMLGAVSNSLEKRRKGSSVECWVRDWMAFWRCRALSFSGGVAASRGHWLRDR
jgi:hypothetical protein